MPRNMAGSSSKIKSITLQFAALITFVVILFMALQINIVEKTPYVSDCQSHDIHTLIMNHDGSSLKVHSVTSGSELQWILTYLEKQYPPHYESVQTLRALMCHLPYEGKYEADALQKVNTDGFLKFSDTRMISFSTGENSMDGYQIGPMTPSGTEFYLLKKSDPDTVFVVSNRYLESLRPAFFDMRIRRVLPSFNPQRITIQFIDESLVLEPNPDPTKVSHKLSNDEIVTLIENIGLLHYESYHGPFSETETLQHGFFLPDVQMQIVDKNGQETNVDITNFEKKYLLRLISDNGDYYVLVLSAGAPEKITLLLQKLYREQRLNFLS
jgi:hypothetical protein